MSKNENEKEQTTQQSASEFLPDIDEIEGAADVCWNYVNYLKKAEPKATHDIDVLEEAANILDATAAFYGDFNIDISDDLVPF